MRFVLAALLAAALFAVPAAEACHKNNHVCNPSTLAAPANFRVLSDGRTLAWNAVSGANSGYRVAVWLDGNSATTNGWNVSGTQFDPPDRPGHTDSYGVAAITANGGYGPNWASPMVSIAYPANPVPTPTATPTATPTPTPDPTYRFRDDFTGASGSYPDMAKWYGICWGIASSAMPCDFVNGDNRSRKARLDGAGHLALPTTTTEGSFVGSYYTFLYGEMTARLKLPAQAGVWTGWWWNNGEGSVDTGEIDTLEAVDPNPRQYYASWHRYNGPTGHTGETWLCSSPVDLSADYHDYTTIWNQFSIAWYVDGQLCKSEPTPIALTFRPGKLMFDTASGGWAGTPGAGAMLVDWVYVK